MSRIRSDLILIASFISTVLVIGNAFYHKKQFYPSVVHITKSNGSMAILYFQALILALLVGKFMNKLFFGQLRAIELEHLMERSWFALTETCLAFTVFRDDFSPKFITMFTVLFFLKAFHWLIEDRVDYMERSPVISLLFHIRVIALSTLLVILDFYFLYTAYQYTVNKGASVQIVFGFEYTVLLISILSTFLKYFLHTIDLQNETSPWENKGIYMLYCDLIFGFTRVVVYFVFVGIMAKTHTFPLFAIRPIYLSLRSFKKCVSDVVLSRRAIRNLNTMYPSVTAEQLSAYSDTICIICREEMNVANGAGVAPVAGGQIKKLPCDHIFHKNCLRSWFQRQQTCPTCRTSILRFNPAHHSHDHHAQPQQPAGAAAAAGQQQAQPQDQPQQRVFTGLFNNNAAGVPLAPQQQQQQQQQQHTVPPFGDQNYAFLQAPPMFPNFLPPFMFPPPPLPELNLGGMTNEELAELEGEERHNVEARIHCLRNINQLLDSAFLHVQQYYNITAANSHLDNLRGKRSTSASVANDLKSAASSTVQFDLNNETVADQAEPQPQVDDKESDLIRQRRLNRFDSSKQLTDSP